MNANEKLFFKVLDDLKEFLPYLVVVGGWVPYVYAKYIWHGISQMPLMTKDIDFGFKENNYSSDKTIADIVQKAGYGERHVYMDRAFPYVPLVKGAKGEGALEVEFIADTKTSQKYGERLIGRGIKINIIPDFNMLLSDLVRIKIDGNAICMPKPEMYAFHKLLTFVNRENREKAKKDIYYAYYVARFNPNREGFVKRLKGLIKEKEEGDRVLKNIKTYFKHADDKGPVYIEEENGRDIYVDDVRNDAYNKIKVFLDE